MTRAPLLSLAVLLLPASASAQVENQPDQTPAPPATPPSPAAPTVIETKPTPPTAPAQDGDEKKWATIVGARFDGGYAIRRLFDIPIRGADIGGAIGGQPLEHGAFWGTLRVMIGSTESGLSFWDVHVGGEGEAVFDRFRIGGGLGFYLLGIARATKDQTIRTWGPEVRAFVRFDVIQADGFALFVRGAIQAGMEFYDSATIWGPTVGAGVDFDLKGKRPSE
jgi:hypothetical protein